MIDLETILDLAEALRHAPRDVGLRAVLHDALLERYPDTYGWVLDLARHDLRTRAPDRSEAARVTLLPRMLIDAENAHARGEIRRAETLAHQAFDVVLLYRPSRAGGLGRWGRKLLPDEIVLLDLHRNQVAQGSPR